jgi:Glycosyl transferase family 2
MRCILRLLPRNRKHRRQVRFIRERWLSTGRSIIGMSSRHYRQCPDRINNLTPTIRSLLKQTRPPDEIVLAIPEFSVRERRHYVVPKHISRLPRVRILRTREDWGPATKFIAAIQDELAAGRQNTLIMVVDDDRVYPRDALETYLHYSEQLPDAALCFRAATMPSTLDWDDATMIRASELREPRPVAVITGCGSYLIQPRFFDESLWDYSVAPQVAFHIDDICLADGSVVAA